MRPAQRRVHAWAWMGLLVLLCLILGSAVLLRPDHGASAAVRLSARGGQR
ncbi:hypothetical protein ACE7GA_17880 [Roseomonas sp. CCTCC AB2023176]